MVQQEEQNMSMEIPLEFLDVYEDSIRRHHLPAMIDVTIKSKEETSRGTVTREKVTKRGYLEIEAGRTYIELTTNNAPIIEMLAQSSLFDYADSGHSKLVKAMLPEEETFIEAEVVEPERVAIAPAEEVEPEVEEEVDLSEEELMTQSMPELKRLAKKKGVKALPSDKKEALVAKIIEG